MIIILAKKQVPDLKNEMEVLSQIKQQLKIDPVTIKIFNDLDKDIEILEGIPIDFSDEIDVSAKTVNSRIILNKALMHEPFEIMMRYAIHELVHALQHMDLQNHVSDPYEDEEYLDRPDELEAFQYQIEFDKNNRGEEEVIEYVEDLVDYHDLEEADKDDKKSELLERIK